MAQISKNWFVLVSACLLLSCASQERTAERLPANTNQSLFAYSNTQMERVLIRGATTQNMVSARFGQPHGMSQSGDYTYWHYIERYYDDEARSGLAILNVVFDQQRRVADFDFQIRHFSP